MMMSTVKKLSLLVFTLALLNTFPAVQALAPESELSSPSSAATDNTLIKQRYHYELAKGALKNKKFDKFYIHYALLGDYPLIPYLDYALIKQDIYSFNFEQIDQFLETNRGTFLEYRLREQVLGALAVKRQWHKYLKYYQPRMDQKSLRCHHLSARIALGDLEAYNDIAGIWTEGRSQPKACDPLFKKWRQRGELSDEIAWQRFNNAMNNNKLGLARYVSRYMGDEYKQYADEYLGIHAYPGRIRQHRRYSEQSLQTQQIIAHGIKRLSRMNPKQALYHWELYEAQQLFPNEISTDTKIYLVKRLTWKGFTEEAEALIQQSQELRNADVIEQLIREALRNEQYSKVLNWINRLEPEAQASDRWQYWRARAQDELGLIHAAKDSTEVYRRLSQTRSFYGFLSSDILNSDYSLVHKPSAVSPSTNLVVENIPAVRRAKELWLKGDYSEAQAEWQFATKAMSPKELAAAGRIARGWGWYNKGILAMIRGNYWDDLDIRFPLAYRETVEKVASNTDVEKVLIYAIARQESAFSKTARSSAGAMGLMQLMPGTARQTARKSGIQHRDSYLFDPEYNINLGSRYLNELLSHYNGNRILAAAAYNAGPHRVAQWIEKTPLDLPFDVWIETIPFKETRGYVQNVLAFSVIYGYRLGQQREFITENEIANPL